MLFYFHSQCFSEQVPDSSTSPSKTPILLLRKESFPFVEDDLYIRDPRVLTLNLSFRSSLFHIHGMLQYLHYLCVVIIPCPST